MSLSILDSELAFWMCLSVTGRGGWGCVHGLQCHKLVVCLLMLGNELIPSDDYSFLNDTTILFCLFKNF